MIPLLDNPLIENRSDQRQAVKLINGMRSMLLQVRQMEFAVATVLSAAATTIWLSDDMPASSAWDVEAVVLGVATDGSAGGYRRIGRLKRGAGASSLVAAPAAPVADAEDVAGWDVTLSASGNGALLQVTGDAARTVNWSALVRVRELKA